MTALDTQSDLRRLIAEERAKRAARTPVSPIRALIAEERAKRAGVTGVTGVTAGPASGAWASDLGMTAPQLSEGDRNPAPGSGFGEEMQGQVAGPMGDLQAAAFQRAKGYTPEQVAGFMQQYPAVAGEAEARLAMARQELTQGQGVAVEPVGETGIPGLGSGIVRGVAQVLPPGDDRLGRWRAGVLAQMPPEGAGGTIGQYAGQAAMAGAALLAGGAPVGGAVAGTMLSGAFGAGSARSKLAELAGRTDLSDGQKALAAAGTGATEIMTEYLGFGVLRKLGRRGLERLSGLMATGRTQEAAKLVGLAAGGAGVEGLEEVLAVAGEAGAEWAAGVHGDQGDPESLAKAARQVVERAPKAFLGGAMGGGMLAFPAVAGARLAAPGRTGPQEAAPGRTDLAGQQFAADVGEAFAVPRGATIEPATEPDWASGLGTTDLRDLAVRLRVRNRGSREQLVGAISVKPVGEIEAALPPTSDRVQAVPAEEPARPEGEAGPAPEAAPLNEIVPAQADDAVAAEPEAEPTQTADLGLQGQGLVDQDEIAPPDRLIGGGEAAFDQGGHAASYTDQPIPQLRAELEDRGLPTAGIKSKLIERLEADDARGDGVGDLATRAAQAYSRYDVADLRTSWHKDDAERTAQAAAAAKAANDEAMPLVRELDEALGPLNVPGVATAAPTGFRSGTPERAELDRKLKEAEAASDATNAALVTLKHSLERKKYGTKIYETTKAKIEAASEANRQAFDRYKEARDAWFASRRGDTMADGDEAQRLVLSFEDMDRAPGLYEKVADAIDARARRMVDAIAPESMSEESRKEAVQKARSDLFSSPTRKPLIAHVETAVYVTNKMRAKSDALAQLKEIEPLDRGSRSKFERDIENTEKVAEVVEQARKFAAEEKAKQEAVEKIQREAAEKRQDEMAAAIVPLDQVKATIVQAWHGNVFEGDEPGAFLSDGRWMVKADAVPPGTATKLHARKSDSPRRGLPMSAARDLFKEASAATKDQADAQIVGVVHNTESGVPMVRVDGSGGTAIYNAVALRYIFKETGADAIRLDKASPGKKPGVIYKDGKPIAVLMPISQTGPVAEALVSLDPAKIPKPVPSEVTAPDPSAPLPIGSKVEYRGKSWEVQSWDGKKYTLRDENRNLLNVTPARLRATGSMPEAPTPAIEDAEMLRRLTSIEDQRNGKGYEPLSDAETAPLRSAGLVQTVRGGRGKFQLTSAGRSRLSDLKRAARSRMIQEGNEADRKQLEDYERDQGRSGSGGALASPSVPLMPSPVGAKPMKSGRVPVAPIAGGPVRKIREIGADFERKLGHAFRTAKPPRGALGVYKPDLTTIVNRHEGDLDTIAHEVGHYMDDLAGIVAQWATPRKISKSGAKLPQKSPLDDELRAPLFQQTTQKRYPVWLKRAEGVAEWIRAWVVNPDAATQAAPKFAKHFEATVPENLRTALREFGDDIRRWAGGAASERVASNIALASDPERPLRERVREFIVGTEVAGSAWQKARARLADALAPVQMVVEGAKVVRGIGDLLPTADPIKRLALHAGINQKLEAWFEHGPMRPDGSRMPGLGNIDWLVEPIAGKDRAEVERNYADLVALLTSERVIEKAQQFKKQAEDEALEWEDKAANAATPEDAQRFQRRADRIRAGVKDRIGRLAGWGAGIYSDDTTAAAALTELAADPARLAKLQEAAKRYRAWANHLLDYAVDTGRMDAQKADEIKKSNQFYVAMQREVDRMLGPRAGIGTYRKAGTARTIIQRFKGGTFEIRDPYANLWDATRRIVMDSDRNAALRPLRDLLTTGRQMYQGAPIALEEFGRKVTAGDAEAIPIYVNGKPEYWHFATEAHRALKGWYDSPGPSELIQFITAPFRLTRALIIEAPQFFVRQAIRDPVQSSIVSRAGTRPWDWLYYLTPKGAREFRETYREFRAVGGGQFGYNLITPADYYSRMRDALKAAAGEGPTIWSLPTRIDRGIRRFGAAREAVVRLAEYRRRYRQGVAKGMSPIDAAADAAYEARGLLDLAVAGSWMKSINQWVLFANAAVQGVRRATQAITERPARTAARLAMYTLIPSLAAYLWNLAADDDDEAEKKLSPYRRDFFWNFRVPGWGWLSIPKPYELGLPASLAERTMRAVEGEEDAFKGFMGSAAKATLPISVDDAAVGPFRTIVELAANHNFFTGRNIVPFWELNKPVTQRRGRGDASGAARLLGDAIGIDARYIEHLIQAQFGGYGRLGVQALRALSGQEGAAERLGAEATGILSKDYERSVPAGGFR